MRRPSSRRTAASAPTPPPIHSNLIHPATPGFTACAARKNRPSPATSGRTKSCTKSAAAAKASCTAPASDSARRRFEREVEAVSTLSHPNIVTVYGMDVIDGQPLLAMEWVDGVTVNKWARPADGPPRDVREVLELFLRICAAVR